MSEGMSAAGSVQSPGMVNGHIDYTATQTESLSNRIFISFFI